MNTVRHYEDFWKFAMWPDDSPEAEELEQLITIMEIYEMENADFIMPQ